MNKILEKGRELLKNEAIAKELKELLNSMNFVPFSEK